MNLILIGPRGVGKSKLSRHVSKKLNLAHVSTDMIAVYEFGGMSISEKIEEWKGDWQKFRELEYSILLKLQTAKNCIVDTGGGILFELENGEEVLSQRKLEVLRSMGKIINLTRSIPYLLSKVENDSTRPNLSNTNTYEMILKRRLPIYKSVADHTLNIEGLSKEDAGEKLIQIIKQFQK